MTPRAAVAWLIAVCFVWGISFVAVKAALVFATPMVLLGLRFALAGLPVAGTLRAAPRAEWVGGLVLGLLFWVGFAFQTAGLRYTTPSRSAFITILSTPLVPLVQYLTHRAAPRPLTLLGVGLGILGTWLLTAPGGGTGLNRGDWLTLGCAVAFAGQIVAAGHLAPRISPSRLVALELLAGAVLSLVFAPVLETPRLDPAPAFLGLLVFLAAGGLWTFRMQLRAQQVLAPSHTALVFCLEPVFAAMASYALLGETLGPTQLLGGALILAAVAVAAVEIRG
jgi:drug/metabolite transporter (DMT)-like permease